MAFICVCEAVAAFAGVRVTHWLSRGHLAHSANLCAKYAESYSDQKERKGDLLVSLADRLLSVDGLLPNVSGDFGEVALVRHHGRQVLGLANQV